MSLFGLGLELGLGPWWFQAPNPHRAVVSPKGRFEGTRDGAGQDPSLAATATHVGKPLVEDASGILS